MENIYFASDLETRVLKALKEAYDCVDVKNDLDRIQWTFQFGTDEQARHFDYELRQKYPTINNMLRAASYFQPLPQSPGYCRKDDVLSFEKSNLKQDYWGILCDTAIKKEIKRSIEDCIDHVG